MKIRPEAEIWPAMSEPELLALAADIDENGQQYPISLFEGDILDGRNRWLAMTQHATKNTKPKFETVEPESPIKFVISRNEKRRHLNESQRGLVAAEALPFFEAEARKRQEAGRGADGSGGRGRKKTSAPIGAQVSHRAADDAAAAFGTSPRNVQRGKAVKDSGSKKLNDAVLSGQLSLGKAEQITKRFKNNKKRQDEEIARVAKSKMATRVKGLTGEIEWYTPRRFLDAAIAVMGEIEIDPASSEAAQAHVKAGQYFTIEMDGLSQKWTGRVFLNPPYAMPFIKQFTAKMIHSWQTGEMPEGILLTNNATDTEWFHNVLEACSAVCLTRGRICFLEASNDELIEKESPTHGQAFFYFGKNADRFTQTFSDFGSVLRRYELDAIPLINLNDWLQRKAYYQQLRQPQLSDVA